jgi:hypothetical protein
MLWDSAGAVAEQILERFPDFQVESASPAEIKLIGRMKPVSLTVALHQVNLNCDIKHTAQSYFYEVSGWTFPHIFERLKVKLLTRIGHRVTYDLKTDSEEKANALIGTLAGGISGLTDLLDPAETRLKEKEVRELVVRFVDTNTGILFQLRPTITRYGVEMPGAEHFAAKLPAAEYAATLDVDVYTIQPAEPGMLNPEALSKANLKMVETRFLNRFQV